MKTLIPLVTPTNPADVSQSGGKMCSIYYDDVQQKGFVIYPDGSIHPLGSGTAPYYFSIDIIKGVPNVAPSGPYGVQLQAVPSIGVTGDYTWNWNFDPFTVTQTPQYVQASFFSPPNVPIVSLVNNSVDFESFFHVRVRAIHNVTGAVATAFVAGFLAPNLLPPA